MNKLTLKNVPIKLGNPEKKLPAWCKDCIKGFKKEYPHQLIIILEDNPIEYRSLVIVKNAGEKRSVFRIQ